MENGDLESRGITTRVALQRIKTSMLEALQQTNLFSWLKSLLVSPAQLISLALTILCGILLIVSGSLNSSLHLIEIVEGCVLLVIGILGLLLHAREVYTQENFTVMKLRRAVSSIAKLVQSLSNPDGVSLTYPSNEIVTNRGYFTTPTVRDGVVVHVPNNLLVEGDVVHLGPDRPAPATLVPIVEKEEHIKAVGNSLGRTIEEGKKIPFDLFEKDSTSISKVGPMNKLFKVTKSPFTRQLKGILNMKHTISLLNNEISFAMKCLFYAFVFIILGSAFLLNVIRYASLPDDFSTWSQMLLTQTVYVVLPVLFFHFPLFRACVNAYGTASVVQLCDSYSRGSGESVLKRRGINAVARFFQILWSPFHYSGWRLFHIFGSTTILCCVDKEYVLCHPRPVPDKVFFLNCQKENEKKIGHSFPAPVMEEEEEEGLQEDSRTDVFDHGKSPSSPAPTKQLSSTMNTLNDVKGKTPLDENPLNSEETSSLHVTFKGISRSSTSLDQDVNINTEILGLSSRLEDPGEIFFDDINWMDFLDSIKTVGFSGVSMSHLVQQFNFTTAETLSSSLLQDLQATDCLCSLGKEIGVTDYAINTFEPTYKSILSVSPYFSLESMHGSHSNSKVSQLWTSAHSDRANDSLLYMFTALFKVAGSSNYQLITRSHSEFALACCQDFWNGNDIIPLSQQERRRIRDFFARRSLLAHAVVLSYNPFLESDSAKLPDHTTLLVPYSHLLTHEDDTPVASLEATTVSGEPKVSYTPSELFQVQCGQIFLGVVSLQHQPYQDVVSLVEGLGKAGIRFVHFSAESELRENVFSERMGLETGWNCHISLASHSAGKSSDTDTLNSDSDHSLSRSSSDSSFGNYMQGKTSYIRAKLPRGVENIRPHIKNVDNVPLLVPLFTDCRPDGIQDMIQIMQENGEVVAAIGNAWNGQNMTTFAQADVSLGLVPGEVGLKCLADMCSDNWTGKPGAYQGSGLKAGLSAIDLATELNTLTCQIVLPRHAEVSVMEIISTSRHFLSCARHSLLFSLGLSVVLALLLLLATVFFLPPPLSGSQLFHFLLFTIPALAVWMLAVKMDPAVKNVVLDKNKVLWAEKWRFIIYFAVSFFPTSIMSVLIFGLSVYGLCVGLVVNSSLPNENGTCHLLLGDRNQSSPWNGWDGAYKPELLIAQGLNAVFLSLCAAVFSLRFLHRTAPIWRLYRFVPLFQFTILPIIPALHIIHALGAYFVAMETQEQSAQRAQLGDVPWYVWVLGVAWLIALCPILELTKRHDGKLLRKSQRFLRLEFETKLGMNSPF